MATPLTFGNPLKFGPNSCHEIKGKQISSSIERESARSPKQTTQCTIILRGALQRGLARGGAITMAGGERGPTTTVAVFPPRSDQGLASTIYIYIYTHTHTHTYIMHNAITQSKKIKQTLPSLQGYGLARYRKCKIEITIPRERGPRKKQEK